MLTPLSPPSIHLPFSNYSHALEVPAGWRIVFCSGQVGIGPDAAIPDGCLAQAHVCFDSIAAILAEAGMTLGNVIKLNAFVTAREHLRPYMDARNARFPAPYPASTLMIVGGFARPEFVVEIEAIAAAPGAAS